MTLKLQRTVDSRQNNDFTNFYNELEQKCPFIKNFVATFHEFDKLTTFWGIKIWKF